MPALYALQCSVCERDYSSKSEWLIHLTSDNHQKLARQNCLEEWAKPEGLKMKKCCLVVYSSFPLTRVGGGAHRLIHHFSKGVRNWVTDFVYWEERPCLAILQFESAKKARAIVASAENNEVLIDNRQVKVKQAVDLWDLEWSAILPLSISSTRNGDGIAPQSATKRPLQPSPEEEEYPNSSEPKRGRMEDSLLHPDPDIGLMTEGTLQHQFWSAIKSVTITETMHEDILEATRCLTALFRETVPNTEVVLFRNCHLKLVNPNWKNNSKLLFYVYSCIPYTEVQNSSYFIITDTKVDQAFGSPMGMNNFCMSKPPKGSRGGFYACNYKPKSLGFTLLKRKQFFMEMHMCRLLKYMCTFDPRCHSLLAITFYWTKINEVAFGDIEEMEYYHASRNLKLPEPLTLEWLVIHFLCYKGIIPTVRQIQERPHSKLRERESGIDVGFVTDSEYAMKWKSSRKALNPTIPDDVDNSGEAFGLSVLELFQEFLEFYGETLADGGWILNTRDGEVINIQDFLNSDPGALWSTKMTSTDLIGLRLLHSAKSSSSDPGNNEENRTIAEYKKCTYRVTFKDRIIYMVNPFVYTWQISISKQISQVLKLMKQSSQQLKMYLKARERKGEQIAMEQFGTLENVLTSNQAEN